MMAPSVHAFQHHEEPKRHGEDIPRKGILCGALSPYQVSIVLPCRRLASLRPTGDLSGSAVIPPPLFRLARASCLDFWSSSSSATAATL